jgi:hypothetical protein
MVEMGGACNRHSSDYKYKTNIGGTEIMTWLMSVW